MSDWDAATYHRISDPQLAWGRTVSARLAPLAGERILDVGCGTGRLTEEIARTPGIRIVGVDRSGAMLREASRRGPHSGRIPLSDSGAHPTYVRGDGAALPFAGRFDAIFSAATFHWIPDHDRLFRSLYAALKPVGRVVAQCGGAGNLDRLYGRAWELMRSPAYAHYFRDWTSPNHFESVADTRRRLLDAGFDNVDVTLVAAPVRFGGPAAFSEFVAAVCLRHHLDRLPATADRDEFMQRITGAALDDEPPLTLDYWRLNIAARKGRA